MLMGQTKRYRICSNFYGTFSREICFSLTLTARHFRKVFIMGKVVALNENITHESEIQRQHIRVSLAGTAKIGGKSYKISNLSAGGFSVSDVDGTLASGAGDETEITFNFNSFTMAVNVRTAPVYYDAERKVAGFRIVEAGRRETSLINYILKSYIAGNLVTEGDVLNVVTRDNYVKPRAKPQSNEELKRNWRRFIPMGLITVACASAMFFFFGNVYESTAIVKSYMGVVEGSVFTVRAPQNGIFESLLPEGSERVTKDQIIAVIHTGTTPGITLTGTPGAPGDIVIKSPCDCLITRELAQSGEFNPAGTPVMQLMPANGSVWVTASLRPEQLYKIQLQDDARVKVAGESVFIEGNVTEFLPPNSGEEMTRVRIRTRTPIMPQMVGRVAYAEFIVN